MKNAFRLGTLALVGCTCGLLSAAELTGANAEVVVAPGAPPTTRFAAAEMTNYLSRVLGHAIPVVTAPTEAATQSSSVRTRGAAPPGSIPRRFPAIPTA